MCFSACLDTSETGDLASCKLMGEFSVDPSNNYDYISASDRMSYSFNVHNDGNVLEIVSLGCKYCINIILNCFKTIHLFNLSVIPIHELPKQTTSAFSLKSDKN